MKQIANISIPESWSEITISQIKQLKNVKEDASINSYFSLLKIFNPATDLLTTDLNVVIEAVMGVSEIIQHPPLPGESTGTYKIDDVEYRLMEVEELDFGKFIDFNNLTDSTDEWDKVSNLPLIIALITEGVENPIEFSKTLEDKLDVITGTSLLVFFSKKLISYMQDTLPSSHLTQEQREKIESLLIVD